MVFKWFKNKIIDTISSEKEMKSLLEILKRDKSELEKEIAEIDTKIDTVSKMIDAISSD